MNDIDRGEGGGLDRRDDQMETLSDKEALDQVAEVMHAQEWSADTLDRIYEIVSRTGRPICDVDNCVCDSEINQ